MGFDDNRELDLEGAHSAAPIWVEFMKRALQFREYRDVKEFQAPDGIVSVEIDPQSGMPATPYCPRTRQEVYIAGTEPVGTCPLHGGGRQNVTNVAGWETPATKPQSSDGSSPVLAAPPVIAQRNKPEPPQIAQPQSPEPPPQQKPKKSLFRRLWGVFK